MCFSSSIGSQRCRFEQEMPISGLVVQAQSGRAEAVAGRLKAFPELEVEPGVGDRLVVVMETANRKQDREVYERIKETEDVLALSLIYANFEDLES